MMSWVGFLLKYSEFFILLAENSQILLKISVTYSHSLNFHFSGNTLSVSKQPTQLIIVAHNCHICLQLKSFCIRPLIHRFMPQRWQIVKSICCDFTNIWTVHFEQFELFQTDHFWHCHNLRIFNTKHC